MAIDERRWDLVNDEKLWARAQRFREEGPLGCLRAAESLPRNADPAARLHARAEDLRGHIAWRLLLDRLEARAPR